MKLVHILEQGHWKLWDGKQSSLSIFTDNLPRAKYEEMDGATGRPKKKKKKSKSKKNK